MQLYSIAALLLVFLRGSFAAYCSGSPDAGTRTNELPISPENIKVEKAVKNGVLTTAGPQSARFPILHVYGTPYEKGYAQGELMKEYLTKFIHTTFQYLTAMVVDEMDDRFPKAVRELIVRFGMKEALGWCAKVTKPFTANSYFEEIQGIADASGVSYDLLIQLNLFPEITKASCSFVGAWGPAVIDGTTFQLRALDYDTDGPFKDYPLITVYHTEPGTNQVAFASVGFPGSVGVLTGFSAAQLGISEIGVSFADDSFGQGTDNTPPEEVHGIPWMYLLRDVLATAKSAKEGIEMIQQANRTCNLIIGVGDGKAKTVNGLEYSGLVAIPYADQDLLPVNADWHPVIPHVTYNAMDWLCPNYDVRMSESLSLYASAGALSIEVMIKSVLPTVQTGNLHAALYDLERSRMYVSFMNAASNTYAFASQWTALDMTALFAQEQQQL
jgi:hypothetical protein